MASMTDWKSVGDKQPGWVTEDSVRIAEYFYKTHEEVTLCLLNTKEVIEKSKLPEILPDGIQVVSERQTVLPAIKWCKINAVEVLEQTDWPGLWIPIIPVLGDELDVDGKKILEGVIRHAKDPQRMYNYWASSETETIALAPRAPFIGVEGQFEGFEEQWRTANVKNHSYLQYKAKTIGGVLAGPPTRQVYEPPVQAITQARMQSSEDLKATTGIYDASLGNRSNENSGIAIQRRNSQAQTNNFHFIDNLSRALRHSGRILLDLIPKVYDTARVVRTLGEDEKIDMVLVNQIFEKNGESVQYNLGTGKYDVTISTGPAFATKRQEAAQDMLEFTKAVPNAAPIISDLIARNMDWPGAEQIADRLKKTLPPGVAEKDENEKQQLPPEAQQQMQQMDQMIQQLTTELN
ncbi:MAG: portal protein, partial [Bdellovibrionales bacterium]